MGYKDVNVAVGGYNHNGTHPQTYKTVILKAGIPLGDQFTEENTIYVVKWDFEIGMNKIYSDLDLTTGGTMTIDGTTYYWSILAPENDVIVNLSDNTVFFCENGRDVLIPERSMTVVAGIGIRVASPFNTYHEKAFYTEANAVVIPENCVLKFEGGSFNNGILFGNYTRLDGNLNGIFSNITIEPNSTWDVPYISTDFFKNISDEAEDETQRDVSKDDLLHNVLRLADNNVFNEVVIKGNYWVNSDYMYDPNNNQIAIRTKSNTKYIIQGSIRMVSHNYAKSTLIHTAGCHNVTITGGGSLYGDKLRHVYYDGNSYPDGYIPGFSQATGHVPAPSGYSPHQNNQIIYVYGTDVVIDDINLYDSTADVLYINKSKNITIKNFHIENGRRNGISVINADRVIIENGYIDTITGTGPEKGIDLEPNDVTEGITRISVRNIYITNTAQGFGVNNTKNAECNCISFDNIKVDNCCVGCNFGNTHAVSVKNCTFNSKGRGFKIYSNRSNILSSIAFTRRNVDYIGDALVENCVINHFVPYYKLDSNGNKFDFTDENMIKDIDNYLTYDENDPNIDQDDVALLKGMESDFYAIRNTEQRIAFKNNIVKTNVIFLRDGEKCCEIDGNDIECRYFSTNFNIKDRSEDPANPDGYYILGIAFAQQSKITNNKIVINGQLYTEGHFLHNSIQCPNPIVLYTSRFVDNYVVLTGSVDGIDCIDDTEDTKARKYVIENASSHSSVFLGNVFHGGNDGAVVEARKIFKMNPSYISVTHKGASIISNNVFLGKVFDGSLPDESALIVSDQEGLNIVGKDNITEEGIVPDYNSNNE